MYKETRIIQMHTVDRDFCLSINHLFEVMIEMGNKHSNSLKLTNQKVLDLGYTWMLYQIKINITRRPKVNEEVVFLTWVSKKDKLKTVREMNIEDKDGNTLIKTSTVWLLVDIEKKKAVKMPEEISSLYKVEEAVNFKDFTNFNRVDLKGEKREFKIYKSDIDYNNHVNSGVYLRWIVDSVDLDNSLLEEVELYYKDQAFMKVEKIEDSYYHQIEKEDKSVVYGKTTWRDK